MKGGFGLIIIAISTIFVTTTFNANAVVAVDDDNDNDGGQQSKKKTQPSFFLRNNNNSRKMMMMKDNDYNDKEEEERNRDDRDLHWEDNNNKDAAVADNKDVKIQNFHNDDGQDFTAMEIGLLAANDNNKNDDKNKVHVINSTPQDYNNKDIKIQKFHNDDGQDFTTMEIDLGSTTNTATASTSITCAGDVTGYYTECNVNGHVDCQGNDSDPNDNPGCNCCHIQGTGDHGHYCMNPTVCNDWGGTYLSNPPTFPPSTLTLPPTAPPTIVTPSPTPSPTPEPTPGPSKN